MQTTDGAGVSSSPRAPEDDALELLAEARDVDAAARDEAADDRDSRAELSDTEKVRRDRVLASRDRAAAALDRQAAALDRMRAAEYRKNAYRDGLTGVLQRDAGRDQLMHEVSRAHRTGGSLVVAFLDVDGLKEINDTFGHGSGDHVLRSLGAALTTGLRDYDTIVRYGGDEFVCALPGSTLGEAAGRFEEVQALLSNMGGTRPELASWALAFSFGLALLTADESLDAVVERADLELYDRRRSERAATAAGG